MSAKRNYERIKVLIVDDSAFIRQSTGRMFEAAGARQVLFAIDGADALRVLSDPAFTIALMVTDLAMPSLDGIDLLARLTELANPPAVALVSGDAKLLAQAKALASERGLRVLAALPKPISLDDIERLLQGLTNP